MGVALLTRVRADDLSQLLASLPSDQCAQDKLSQGESSD